MREPGTAATIAGAITNALTAIKDFPLWLLTGIALFLIAFLIVPAPQSRSGQWTALGPIPHRKVRIGSKAAVVARSMVRPVCPQLRKCRVRPRIYASCDCTKPLRDSPLRGRRRLIAGGRSPE